MRLDVFCYWLSFFVAFLALPFIINGEWFGLNALFGLLLGLMVLSQTLIENAVVSTQRFPRLVEWNGSAPTRFLLNLVIGGIAGAATTFGLIVVWNILGPEPDSFEFGWHEYVQWVLVAVPTLIVSLVVPLTGACLIVRRPEPRKDV